ncbi:hypothetical protein BDV06DRAFT_213639 [Aspergillus oleicola]
MESAAQAILVTLLLGLGFIIVRSGAWRKSLSPPVMPPRSSRKSSPEEDTDRTSTPQSSPLPPSTAPPVAEQNLCLSPYNQYTSSAPQQAILPSKKSTDYTVGWICAIVTEYVAAQEFLDEEHEAPDFVSPGDTNDYTLGKIGKYNVVIAVLPDGENGIAPAATVATNMQNSFPNVRIGLLVGIGGSVPSERHDIRLGNVVVSAPRDGKGGVFQYDFGKTMQEYGRPPGNTDTLFRAEVSHNLKGCAGFCASNLSNIIQRRARTTNEQNPAIYHGLIASANQVMKDVLVRDQLAAENDILCFEMEAAGLMNQFPCLVIRGICDYADSHKNKEWQGFAAMTAAAYANDILRRIPPSSVEAEIKISEILLDLYDTNDFAKERLSDKEERCHQLFRLTSDDSGGDATYEWYKNRVEDRADNTCLWFLQHENFQKWLQNKSGPLLVSADPGCGKSVLAQYLINSYLPRSATICYFFFKDKVQDKVWQALCALLHQLFYQKPSLIKHAMPEYSKDGEGLINLIESLWKSGPIIIVLDALDKCSLSEFPDLTRNVESQFHGDQLGQGKLKYLLTCYPYEPIMSEFGSLLRTFPNIRIPGEEESETISYKLAQKKNLSSKKTPHRTYLWVYLVFNYLEEENFKKTVKGVESTLTKIPETVNQAYKRILDKSKEHSTVRKALSIILAASRLLTLSEINIVVSVDNTSWSFNDLDLEDKEDFKSRLRTLESTSVTLETRWYHSIAITQAHEVLLTTCVLYLNFFNTNTTISIHADEDNSNFAGSDNFLDYSAKNWTTYFREAGSIANDAILQSTLRICDPKSSSYGAWFRFFWETTGFSPTKHFTDLMLASYCGHSATTKLLLENGAEIEAKDSEYGRTPLSWAAGNGHEAVVKLLLETGKVDVDSKDSNYDVDSRSQYGRTPLSWAAANGHETVIKLLLETGKLDVDSRSQSQSGRTPLSWAAENGHEAVVKLLHEAESRTI